MSGGAIRHSSARWPTPRAPISRTRKRVSGVARSTVSGRPSSLLNEPAVATVEPASLSTRASMSLALVLPWEPVIATTRSRSGAVAETAQHHPGQLLQCGPGVGDQHRRRAGRPGAEDGSGAADHCPLGVVVPVHVLAVEGHEQAPGRGVAAVEERRAGHDEAGLGVHHPAVHEVGELAQGQRDHRPTCSVRAARTSSRSSKGCTTPSIS